MAAGIELTVPTPEEWNRPVEQGRQIMMRAVELTAQAAWSNIPRESPTADGVLGGSFGIEQIDDLSWKIYTNTSYAEIVQEGRGSIEAAPGRVLAFEINGDMVFVKRVGPAAPNPYITRSLEDAQSRTEEFMRQAVSEVVGG